MGYRGYDDDDISFPFGHGLSYTTFQYAFDDGSVCDDGDDVVVCWRVRVTNTGSRSGSEVVQLYATYPSSANEPPVPLLKTFAKARDVLPGESSLVSLALTARDVSYWR